MYIANRAFSGLRKFSAIYKHRHIFNLAFKMNKLKTKYKNMDQSKPEFYRFLLPYLPYTKR